MKVRFAFLGGEFLGFSGLQMKENRLGSGCGGFDWGELAIWMDFCILRDFFENGESGGYVLFECWVNGFWADVW
jgi:hypothetical protein